MNNLIEEDKDTILIELLEEMTWINKTNITTELSIKENNKKEEKTNEELVPEEFRNYLDIFNEEKAHQFPEPRPWDHKIKIKEGFEPKSFKNLLSRKDSQTRDWTQDHLDIYQML